MFFHKNTILHFPPFLCAKHLPMSLNAHLWYDCSFPVDTAVSSLLIMSFQIIWLILLSKLLNISVMTDLISAFLLHTWLLELFVQNAKSQQEVQRNLQKSSSACSAYAGHTCAHAHTYTCWRESLNKILWWFLVYSFSWKRNPEPHTGFTSCPTVSF